MVLFFPGGMGWSNSLGQTWKTTNSCFKAYSRLDLWYSCAWKTCFLGLRFWLVLSDGYHWVFCPEKSEKWDDHPDAQHWLLNTDSRSEHPGVGPSLFNADEVMLFLHFTMWTRFFIPQLSAGCGCLVKSFSVWKLSFQLWMVLSMVLSNFAINPWLVLSNSVHRIFGKPSSEPQDQSNPGQLRDGCCF